MQLLWQRMEKRKNSLIWNPYAIDYTAGVDIYDPTTGFIWSEEAAKKLPEEVRKRLIMRPRKLGCWVMTTEEAEECLRCRKLFK